MRQPNSCNHNQYKSPDEIMWLLVIYIILSFPIGIGVWKILTLPSRYQAEVDFRLKAHSTTGFITDIKRSNECHSMAGIGLICNSRCQAKVRFVNYQDRTIDFWERCNGLSVQRYQEIPVLYNPMMSAQHQDKARIDRGDTPESWASSDLTGSLFVIGIGALQFAHVFSLMHHERKRI